MYLRLTRVTECMYVDDEGKPYFCVEDFLHENQLPDTPEGRQVVIKEFKETEPGMLIVEEQNVDELILEDLIVDEQNLEEMN